jgi:hypothetical protein
LSLNFKCPLTPSVELWLLHFAFMLITTLYPAMARASSSSSSSATVTAEAMGDLIKTDRQSRIFQRNHYTPKFTAECAENAEE